MTNHGEQAREIRFGPITVRVTPKRVDIDDDALGCLVLDHKTALLVANEIAAALTTPNHLDSGDSAFIRKLARETGALFHDDHKARLERIANALEAPDHLVAALERAREAISMLNEDALGYAAPPFVHDPERHQWPIRDELLAEIDKALTTPNHLVVAPTIQRRQG